MKAAPQALLVLLAGLLVGCGGAPAEPVAGSARPELPASEQPITSPEEEPPAPVGTATEPARSELLQADSGGDGDSWRDTAGSEYRLGLVNAPESDECYGSEATRRRQELTSSGFRAEVYETDRYGRGVAVVTTSDGLALNVYLARYGYADDRFLAEFRDENPSLAAELDTAFAAAKAEGLGLWSACRGPATAAPPPVALVAPPPPVAFVAPPAAGAGCHPDYLTCVPVKGTGSGAGDANDLDCGSIGFRVELRQAGVDPYRLDGEDDNGFGCEG